MQQCLNIRVFGYENESIISAINKNIKNMEAKGIPDVRLLYDSLCVDSTRNAVSSFKP